MTDEFAQPSWSDGSQEEIDHLLSRRQYLAERMDAATDPNLRSSFAYELNVLDARLADLNRPTKVGANLNGLAAQAAGNGSSGPPMPATPDDVPEEFFQTMEISSVDLDAVAWPTAPDRADDDWTNGNGADGDTPDPAPSDPIDAYPPPRPEHRSADTPVEYPTPPPSEVTEPEQLFPESGDGRHLPQVPLPSHGPSDDLDNVSADLGAYLAAANDDVTSQPSDRPNDQPTDDSTDNSIDDSGDHSSPEPTAIEEDYFGYAPGPGVEINAPSAARPAQYVEPAQPAPEPEPVDPAELTEATGSAGNGTAEDRRRYFDDDEIAATETEIQLDGLGRGPFRIAPTLAVAGACLALLVAVLWLGGNNQTNETAQSVSSSAGKAPSQASQQVGPEMAVANVRQALDELFMERVVVDYRDGTIHVGGPVPSQADLASVSAAVQAAAGDFPVDTTALVVLEPDPQATTTTPAPAGPSAARANGLLQSELDRILAVTPLIFDTAVADLTPLHQRALNSVVLVLQNQPGVVVTITGYTDEEGTEAANRQISLSRAENVKAYLVSQGVDPNSLQVEARGEDTASGSTALAGLERRVEFEVEGSSTPPPPPPGPLRVALVAPSAMNDLAFTQSMVDSLNLMVEERGIELSVTDNTFVPEDAAAVIESYAEQGFDLVIAHGSQFGASLIDIASRHPDVAFAWGTASDTFDLPNVYAYDAAAEEGGYVLGTVATLMSANRITGVVGPIDVGDASKYVQGFQAGAVAQDPASNVLVAFTGSFSDIGLASEAAQAHINAGAQVLTGSAQMVVGAISTADQQGVKWFGTQANQASLAPNSVVASQVYRWEVALRPILDDVAAGTLRGTRYTATLANGGLSIEFNPVVPVSPEILQRAEEVRTAIINGQIDP